MKDIEDFKDEWRNEANSEQIRKMKKIKLPPNYPKPPPESKVLSARVSLNHFEKWEKLQFKDGNTRIRPCDLMEYMVDHFYEEVYGENNDAKN